MSLPSVPIMVCKISKNLKIWSFFLSPGSVWSPDILNCGYPSYEEICGLNWQAYKSELKLKVFRHIFNRPSPLGCSALKTEHFEYHFDSMHLLDIHFTSGQSSIGSREKAACKQTNPI